MYVVFLGIEWNGIYISCKGDVCSKKMNNNNNK